MPRYFFDVVDGDPFEDRQGTVLRNVKAARREAVGLAGELLCDKGRSAWDGTEWRMNVFDANRNLVITLRFSIEQRSAGVR